MNTGSSSTTAQEGIDPSKLKLKNPWYGDLFFEILGKCRNVTGALAFLEKHSYAFRSQVMLADAEGRSVIINAQAIVEKTVLIKSTRTLIFAILKTETTIAGDTILLTRSFRRLLRYRCLILGSYSR